ncbi:MAG: TRAP transporter large permease, partial [Rhodobacteraceae bacterium]|nr:TRAP transporter large permease [Paracoccaceae bacterium]
LVSFFILMGIFATNSGISRELFKAGNAWLGPFRGGLGLSTIAACGGFAAICGSSVATAATMTKIALPEMRRYGYREDAATGVIAAGGTLGILIPPSVVMVVYAYITETDVGKLFIAGIVPGLLAICMYMAALLIGHRKSLPAGSPFDLRDALRSLAGIWAVVLLFVMVIGSIYWGVATPTEASAIGALLTMLVGVFRGRLSFRQIVDSLTEALRTSVSVYTVLIGAILFGYFLAITQSPQKLTAWLVGLDFGPMGTLGLILLVFVIAGCILDSMAMIILMVPIVYPVIVHLGFDPIWFGIIIVMTAELGLITPPVGINVYVINMIAKEVKLPVIFRGVMPFIVADLFRLGILVAFPAIVLWLPRTM